MLLQRVWHTACIRIFHVRQTAVSIYFSAYNRSRTGQKRNGGGLTAVSDKRNRELTISFFCLRLL